MPTDPITIGEATTTLDGSLVTRILVPVTGTPGATVHGWIGSSGGGGSTTLDATGNGSIELRPTLPQILSNAPVTFQYTKTADPTLRATTTVRALGVTAR